MAGLQEVGVNNLSHIRRLHLPGERGSGTKPTRRPANAGPIMEMVLVCGAGDSVVRSVSSISAALFDFPGV